MAITISPAPGVYVIQDSTAISPAAVAPIEFGTCYMLATTTTGTAGVPVDVISATDFTTKFGVSPSLDYVTTLFDLYPSIKLKVIRAGTTTTPTAAAYVAALGTISKDFDPGILIAPDAFDNLSNQADRTAVFQAMDTAAKTYRWISFVDTGAATDTVAEAGTESDLYRASERYSALYYGNGLSAIAAAQALRGFAEQGQFTPPAGKYEIPQTVLTRHGLDSYVVTKEEQDLLAPDRINAMRRIQGRVMLFDAQTLSSDPALGVGLINSLISANITEKTLETSFDVFRVLDDATVEDLLRSIVAIMDGLSNAGAFRRNSQISDGRILANGYTVERPTIPASSVAEVIVGYVPIGTLRQVVIRTVRLNAIA